MHIQSIHSINNNNQTNFKARFINDKNGYFRELWDCASKSEILFNKAKHFSNILPDDTLEITNKISKYGYHFYYPEYEIFNHNTGAKSLYQFPYTPQFDILNQLLDLIATDEELFNNRRTSGSTYNLLLGKNRINK